MKHEITANNVGTFETTLRSKRWQRYVSYHSIWFKDPIVDPYLTINAFLDASSIEDFNTDLYEILQSCGSSHGHRQCSPADVVYFFERIESVINAAFLIWRVQCIATCYPKNFIADSQLTDTLQQFFHYKTLSEWKSELYEIFSFALSKHSMHESGAALDMLGIYRWSVKLAATLTDWRNSD